MQTILNRIKNADDDEILQIILAVRERYRRTNPNWEIIFLSLPKNVPDERRRSILAVTQLLTKEPEA